MASNSMVEDDGKSSSLSGTRGAMRHGPGMIGVAFAVLRLFSPDELLYVFPTKQTGVSTEGSLSLRPELGARCPLRLFLFTTCQFDADFRNELVSTSC